PVLTPHDDARKSATPDTGTANPDPATATTVSEPATRSDAAATTDAGAKDTRLQMDWRAFFIGAYLTGALMLLMRLIIGTAQANRLRRGATKVDGRLTSDRCTTPITVGWFAPALILPRGWTEWSTAQLEVVLTHEQEHARRHDPLVQWLALFN